MFDFIKQHKVLVGVIFANIIAILVAILIIVIHNSKTATIDIMVAPSGAEISLNGKKYDNFTSYNVVPGDYQVVIEMEGMQTREYDLTLEDGEFARIWNYLVDADGGFTYYESHPDEVEVLKDVADGMARDFIGGFENLYAITDVLPLTFSNTHEQDANEIVSISIRLGEEGECEKRGYCLVVTDYTGKNTEKALAMIRDAGYNPDDYEIIFKKKVE